MLFLCSGLCAQELPYHILFLTKSTVEPIPFVVVRTSQNDTLRTIGYSDVNGRLTIYRSQLPPGDEVMLDAHVSGYMSVHFAFSKLTLNDTFVCVMADGSTFMNAIQLIRYEEPQIDPDVGERPWWRIRKAELPRRDTLPPYTREQLAAYDSLRNGHYHIVDSLRGSGRMDHRDFGSWLLRTLNIPQSSIDHKEEGTIYIEFDIDSNGYVQNIACVHGSCIAFALYTADVLARTPRLVQIGMHGESIALPPGRLCLPVTLVVN